jgi:hypothetical protein
MWKTGEPYFTWSFRSDADDNEILEAIIGEPKKKKRVRWKYFCCFWDNVEYND